MKTEACSPVIHKELNAATNHRSLETGIFTPVSDVPTASNATVNTTLWDPEAEYLAKLCPYSRPTEMEGQWKSVF
jgi:hypothetical protein